MLFLIIILFLVFAGGGFYGYRGGHLGGRGISIGSVLLIVLLAWIVMGHGGM